MAYSKRYQYTQLPTGYIRLLKPRIEKSTGILLCDLSLDSWTMLVDPARQFLIAGETLRPGIILFKNGSYLILTNSATEILRYVMACNQESIFWIDQICINQLDTEEKAAQVAMMGDIYSSRLRVIVWLGTGLEHEDLVIELVEQLVILTAKW